MQNEYLRYHENGRLRIKSFLQNDKIEGLTEVYYEDGSLKFRGMYKAGKKDGVFEVFHEARNGQLEKKLTYRNGIREGAWEEYAAVYDPQNDDREIFVYRTGPLEAKGFYKNGKREGLFETWHDAEDFNHNLAMKCYYKNGKKDGPYEDYFENGNLETRATYAGGRLEGLCEKYYPDGVTLRQKITYKDGKRVRIENFSV